jgi:hypothetical protein
MQNLATLKKFATQNSAETITALMTLDERRFNLNRFKFFAVQTRVARWFFQTKNPNLGKFWRAWK